MRVQVVDPSAFTPPYDHALCAALAREGAEVELVTSRFLYGPVPDQQGYAVNEAFYRRHGARGLGARGRLATKLAEHVPDMLRFRRAAEADVVHWQWLTLPLLDRLLLAPVRPRVLTLHAPLPRRPARRVRRSLRGLVERFDAVVVHSDHAAARLRDELGVDAALIERIEHGALDYLTRIPDPRPLPPELSAVEAPVILSFGLIRPYKGIDVLIEAFSRLGPAAELWIVGMPRMPLGPLRERAARARGTVRFVDRFVTDPEIPAYMRRADIVALPYREVEQSGVLYAALAFGRPLVLSEVGGFPEVAARGAARLVPPGDPEALAEALAELLGDEGARQSLARGARHAAAGPYAWDRIAARTLALYRRLIAAS